MRSHLIHKMSVLYLESFSLHIVKSITLVSTAFENVIRDGYLAHYYLVIKGPTVKFPDDSYSDY